MMINYCITCENYDENDLCDVCEGTENNHVHYKPDFVKRKNSLTKHETGERTTDDFIRRTDAINAMFNILTSPTANDEFNIGVRRCMSSVDAIPNADVRHVVRCKDCIHFELLKCSTYYYASCRWHGRLFGVANYGGVDARTWFCADGEMRTK